MFDNIKEHVPDFDRGKLKDYVGKFGFRSLRKVSVEKFISFSDFDDFKAFLDEI